MDKFLDNIKQFFLLKKFENIKNTVKKYSKKNFNTKTSSIAFGDGDEVNISGKTKELVEQVKQNVSAIVKKTNAEPNELINYVKAANTKVFQIKNSDKKLKVLNQEEGLVCEYQGIGALYLSLLTGQGVRFKTEPMFIINYDIDKFTFLHSFYRWYSLKSGLGGFDYKTQNKLKDYIKHNSDQDTQKLSLEDVISLREAVARDQEATHFVLQYMKETEGAKNVLDKMTKGDGASI